MTKPKIYITRKLPDKNLQILKEKANVDMWDDEWEPVPHHILLEKAQQADGMLTMLTERVDKSFFDHAPHLKIVANMAVGYDNIDIQEAKKRGVIVTNTPDVLTETTADLAFGLLMAAARRIVEASEYVKAGSWKNWGPFLLAGKDLHRKTLGIVGMGRIGAAVAKRSKGFDMNILYHNRSRDLETEEELGASYVSFEKLLKESDFVVCLTPLTEDTKGMFNKKAFELMKNDAVFVNVGRGPVVDEQALYEALKTGEIGGAGLDVCNEEPIRPDHPLLSLRQAVILPHIGSASVETRHAMIDLAVKNLYQVLIESHSPLTPV
ncbi:glyoxylate reductase [Scopulibacillus daqui]|uniref:Glyoxylate reductase n=1 Tax=Scopulibacillus daqui TaxID=1469162 RepID=A0ABS2Q1R5_9BACL|nr:D-glycerate dehydrogenase [Scopulibacillus daqui]MBM7646086.1 glyoxylate reductase [Scopulibacillus daqui]